MVSSIQREKDALSDILIRLKTSSPEDAAAVLQEINVLDGVVQLTGESGSSAKATVGEPTHLPGSSRNEIEVEIVTPNANASEYSLNEHASNVALEELQSDIETYAAAFNPSNHVSVDEQGQVRAFGLTSTHHDQEQRSVQVQIHPSFEEVRDQLIANAALQRQREYQIRDVVDVDGVSVELATHLLDVHWNRPHHTFLLTYRPAIMRDLIHGGPYCSKLLLNAIFASSSKYSARLCLRDHPDDPLTAGGRFYRRCDELISTESPFGRPSIPTIIAFLLLGSSFVARGEISKGWSYSGFAFRMIYDMGLHIDYHKPKSRSEDIEIRRRLFWGAFINDKMQSLYLGRPFAMRLEDSHCSDTFMDTFEEYDLWTPYSDPEDPSTETSLVRPMPIFSVSTFQQLCHLSKLMTRIMNAFYSSNIDVSQAQSHLQSLDLELGQWLERLPSTLVFTPWLQDSTAQRHIVPPNIMNLHNTYHSLVILLNRPFVSDGHLRSFESNTDTAVLCWSKCTLAARYITSIIASYRSACGLRGAPYLTAYAAYVSCTIHVRNAALERGRSASDSRASLLSTLRALDEMSTPNPGTVKPAEIIRRLMRKHGVSEPQGK